MEHRDRTRRKSRRGHIGRHGAPRRCALGTAALHTQPVGWDGQHARAAHPFSHCKGPLSS